MTNTELESKLGALVREERKLTQEILLLIREADRRRLYLERGYPNIYDWLTKAYGYSHASANRRIQAARLLEAVPEARAKLEEGRLNLTTLTQVQSAVRKAERECGKPLDLRRELVEKIEGKSSLETERILAAEFPEMKPKESVRIINAEEAKLTIVLSKEDLELLARAKELLSQKNPRANNSQVISLLLKEFVNRKAPEKKSAADKRRVTNSKKQALLRAGGQCEFRDPKTGRVCGSRFQIEVDHIKPRAQGGSDVPENLRCLCKQHNLLEAERKLGGDLMHRYWKRL